MSKAFDLLIVGHKLNVECHYRTTGKEIIQQLGANKATFVKNGLSAVNNVDLLPTDFIYCTLFGVST